MYREALAAVGLAVVLLYLAPSSTPYSPYNPGPDGLSIFASMCRGGPVVVSTDPSLGGVVLLAPGASAGPISASLKPIVDPYLNWGGPYVPVAYSAWGAVVAPNATPLVGPGEALVWTSPASYSGGRFGPFPLALRWGNVTVFHVSLFTNRAMQHPGNRALAARLCSNATFVPSLWGDGAHVVKYLFSRAPPEVLGAFAAAALPIYIGVKRVLWRRR